MAVRAVELLADLERIQRAATQRLSTRTETKVAYALVVEDSTIRRGRAAGTLLATLDRSLVICSPGGGSKAEAQVRH
jgi:hypothetical protein